MLLAIAIATAPFAQALAGPAEDKATARELAKEGIAAGEQGDCATAIDRLERAESLYHAPPHLQYLARCYTKVGRLVDATETWRKLTLESLPPNAPPAFKDAITEAQAELPKIEPRLARLTVRSATKYEGLSVEVDGKAWPSAALDVPRVIDPGTHVLKAKATGFKTTEQSIALAEGKSDSVTITLEAGSDPGPAPSTSASSSAKPLPSTSVTPSSGLGPVQVAGLVTAGVGVLGLAAGGVSWLIGNSKYSKLKSDCPIQDKCTIPDLEQRKSSIQTYGIAATVFAISGGVLAAAGLGMTLFGSPKKTNGSAVGLVVTPFPNGGHVTLTGSF